MKKLLLLLFVTVVAFSSCKRYEDGPSMSLRSAKARLVGEWELEKYLENKVDYTSEVLEDGGMSMVFKKNGDCEMYFWGERDLGTWEFNSSKKKILLTIDGETDVLDIARLTKKQLWIYSEDDEDKIEIEMKKKK